MDKQHKLQLISVCFLFVVGLFCAPQGWTATGDKNQPVPQAEMSAEETATHRIQEIQPGVFAVQDIRVYVKEGRVELPVALNMSEGLLEYLLVGEQGKVHESLLSTKVEPSDLQIALLMLGLEGTTNPLTTQGEDRIPEGSPVRLKVLMDMKDGRKELTVENWIVRRSNGERMKPMDWIFTGSVIFNGQFMAQMEKSIVAIYHDPVAIIDNELKDNAHDEFWFVNKENVPAVGTEMILVIQKVQKG